MAACASSCVARDRSKLDSQPNVASLTEYSMALPTFSALICDCVRRRDAQTCTLLCCVCAGIGFAVDGLPGLTRDYAARCKWLHDLYCDVLLRWGFFVQRAHILKHSRRVFSEGKLPSNPPTPLQSDMCLPALLEARSAMRDQAGPFEPETGRVQLTEVVDQAVESARLPSQTSQRRAGSFSAAPMAASNVGSPAKLRHALFGHGHSSSTDAITSRHALQHTSSQQGLGQSSVGLDVLGALCATDRSGSDSHLHKHGATATPARTGQAPLSRLPSCAVCSLPVRGLSWTCGSCGHGGHWPCIRGWFRYRQSGAEARAEDDLRTMCPTGCGCGCALVRKGESESEFFLPTDVRCVVTAPAQEIHVRFQNSDARVTQRKS